MRFVPCVKKHDNNEYMSKEIDREIKNWIKTYNEAIKLLLLGTGESGKTTIIKQMKILHVQGFSASERNEKVQHIRNNIHEAINDIVRHMSVLGITLQNPKNLQSIQFILEYGKKPLLNYSEEYYDHVRNLWNDRGVRECFKRSNEYQLIDSAEYFLDRIDLIAKHDYVPSDADILRCRQKTTGIQKIEFKVKVPKSMQGGVQDFWMFDVGGQRGERKKWIQVFEGIHAIWFIVATSDFDQNLREDDTTNRLREALTLFEDVWNSRHAPRHSCSVCSRTFRSASVLGDHLRTHTGERPFPCDLCPLAFRRSTAMRNHRLVHCNVRAWACGRCPKRFRIRSDLRTHMRLRHPECTAVVEIEGLNPSSKQISDILKKHNFCYDKIIEIVKMSFAKGTTSVIPHSARTLSSLSATVPTQIVCSKPTTGQENTEIKSGTGDQQFRRGRGISKTIRKPKILQHSMEETPQNNEASHINMFLQDGVVINNTQMHFNDAMVID